MKQLPIVVTCWDTLLDSCTYCLWICVSRPHISSLLKICSMRCLAFPIIFLQIEAFHGFLMVGWSFCRICGPSLERNQGSIFYLGEINPQGGRFSRHWKYSKYAGQPENINVLPWHWVLLLFEKKKSSSGGINLTQKQLCLLEQLLETVCFQIYFTFLYTWPCF